MWFNPASVCGSVIRASCAEGGEERVGERRWKAAASAASRNAARDERADLWANETARALVTATYKLFF